MQNGNTDNGSGWLSRFQGVERTEDQLVHTAKTTAGFCDAVKSISQNAKFERQPSSFFALLHELAPDELKK